MFSEGKKYLLSLFLLFIVVSCELGVEDVELPAFKQQLVIGSFISPGDSVSYISAYSNQRVLGELNRNESTGNLTAFLSDGSREIQLDTTESLFRFHPEVTFSFYPEDMRIEDGKTYTLRIQSDKGLSAEAICTVPIRRKVEIEVDTFETFVNQEGRPLYYRSLVANISLNDYEGENNYYRISGEQESYYSAINYSLINRLAGEEKGISDNGWDGTKKIVFNTSLSDPSNSDSSFLKVIINYINKDYYLYTNSLSKIKVGESPFSEDSPLYSNIKGGLGIFCAYTSDTVTFRLK